MSVIAFKLGGRYYCSDCRDQYMDLAQATPERTVSTDTPKAITEPEFWCGCSRCGAHMSYELDDAGGTLEHHREGSMRYLPDTNEWGPPHV